MNEGNNKRSWEDFENQCEIKKKAKICDLKDNLTNHDPEISNHNSSKPNNSIVKLGKYKKTFTPKEKDNKLLEAAVLKWLQQARDRAEAITDEAILQKAWKLHEIISGSSEFHETKLWNRWLSNFRRRYGINSMKVKIKGLEDLSNNNLESIKLFSRRLKEKIISEKVPLENIYNADEAGICWRTIATCLEEQDTEIKKCENVDDRVSAVFCSNATGSHRIPLLIAGENLITTSLTRFKNINLNERFTYFTTLNALYTEQASSRIDKQIFLLWYKDVFIPHVLERQEMRGTIGKVILILDNAPCHPSLSELNSINKKFEVVFLNYNLMPIIQPMMQGLIPKTKKFYKRNLLRELPFIEKTFGAEKHIKNFGLRECVRHLGLAWNSLESATLQNAWKPFFSDLFPEGEDSFPIDQFSISSNEIEGYLSKLLLPSDSLVDKSLLWEWFKTDDDDDDECGWEPLSENEILQWVSDQQKKEADIKNGIKNFEKQQIVSTKVFDNETKKIVDKKAEVIDLTSGEESDDKEKEVMSNGKKKYLAISQKKPVSASEAIQATIVLKRWLISYQETTPQHYYFVDELEKLIKQG